jgi:hypothetical protein
MTEDDNGSHTNSSVRAAMNVAENATVLPTACSSAAAHSRASPGARVAACRPITFQNASVPAMRIPRRCQTRPRRAASASSLKIGQHRIDQPLHRDVRTETRCERTESFARQPPVHRANSGSSRATCDQASWTRRPSAVGA